MRIRPWWMAFALVACGGGGGAGDEPGWVADVEAPPPTWLSETGLFADVAARTPADGVVPYTPPHALWSNGADKQRLLYLPPGTRIDTSDPEHWDFPVGTVVAKTFGFDGVEGREGVAPIETRVLFRRADGWRFAVYQWSATGDEARIAGDRWAEKALTLHDASGTPFPYKVPGLLDCKACHETNRFGPVIGIGALNFDPDLVGRGVFTAAPTPVPLPGRTPAETEAMGYFVGNCVHCHHGRGGGENASFSLLPADVVADTVGKPTEASASGAGIRVVAGDPDHSAIVEAVVRAPQPGYRGEFKPMPPLGVTRVDPEAERILRAWIGGL